jgi:predicted  nucleic acid-binding Zn-ribbon protein
MIAIEVEVASVREIAEQARDDATAARVLAAGAEDDVQAARDELRSHTGRLNALRETQLDHQKENRQMLADLRRAIDDDRRQNHQFFANLAAGMAHITRLLTLAEDRGTTNS